MPKKKLTFRETLAKMLNSAPEVDSRPLTSGEEIARQLIAQASEGNIKAAEFIRDTLGEKPGGKAPDSPAPVQEIKITVVD